MREDDLTEEDESFEDASDDTMAPPDVSKLKLSAYMAAKPKLWFSIIEAKMKLAGLKIEDPTHQESMFALVLGSSRRRWP